MAKQLESGGYSLKEKERKIIYFTCLKLIQAQETYMYINNYTITCILMMSLWFALIDLKKTHVRSFKKERCVHGKNRKRENIKTRFINHVNGFINETTDL